MTRGDFRNAAAGGGDRRRPSLASFGAPADGRPGAGNDAPGIPRPLDAHSADSTWPGRTPDRAKTAETDDGGRRKGAPPFRNANDS